MVRFDDLNGSKPIVLDPRWSVRDFAILPGGDVFAAAIELPGTSHELPIPGKLTMMRSSDLKTWLYMDVDYRAVASEATLAVVDAHKAWVATDTGMILKLE